MSLMPEQTTNAILKMIEALSKKVDQLTTTTTPPSNVNPKTGRPYRQCCWSCGCYDHWGKHCTDKKSGHQENDNFKDCKGGSNKNCLPARD